MRICADFHAGPSRDSCYSENYWRKTKPSRWIFSRWTFSTKEWTTFALRSTKTVLTVAMKTRLPIILQICSVDCKIESENCGAHGSIYTKLQTLEKATNVHALALGNSTIFSIRLYFSRYICWVFCLRWVITKVNYIKMLILYSNTLLHLLTSPCYSSISKPSKNALI